MKVVAAAVLAHSVFGKKAGLSAINCDDAKTLGLQDSWHYNWNALPGSPCADVRATEFVPMLWGMIGSVKDLPDDYWSIWQKHGVKHLLGFNEPDNEGQSDITPMDAAKAWPIVQNIAELFTPPLELVSPAMTHWSEDGTPWLDQFFGNCTEIAGCDPSKIKYVAFHDYEGDADSLMKKAEGSAKKYNRQIWLTEFSVGYAKHRPDQDAFMRKIIPMLEASDSIFRYAWYTTRNVPDEGPDAWVAESSLLPYYRAPWSRRSNRACSDLTWLSGKSWGQGSLAQCGASAVANSECASPTTIVYESGGDKNCYCAPTACNVTHAQWQKKYVRQDRTYSHVGKFVCSTEDDMLWLANGDDSTLDQCKIMAELTKECIDPTTISFESGGNHNCYCAKSNTCERTASPWLEMYVIDGAENATSQEMTSTGKLYKQFASVHTVVV